LIEGFQCHHELDPPRYVEADLGDDSSWDQVFCLPSCQSPVVKHGLQGPRHTTVQCGQRRQASLTQVIIDSEHAPWQWSSERKIHLSSPWSITVIMCCRCCFCSDCGWAFRRYCSLVSWQCIRLNCHIKESVFSISRTVRFVTVAGHSKKKSCAWHSLCVCVWNRVLIYNTMNCLVNGA